MNPQAWRWYLAFGVAVAILYFAFPPAHWVLWATLGYCSAIATIVGVRRNRPNTSLPWYLLAGAQLAFAVGDTAYNVRGRIVNVEVQVPTPADISYLSMYVLAGLALLLMIRARASPAQPVRTDGTDEDSLSSRPPSSDLASLLDAIAITTGLALLVWTFLIVPYVRDPQLSSPEKFTAIAYPLGDILLLAMLVRLWTDGGRDGTAFRLLGLAGLGILAADVLYGLMLIEGTWETGGPVDVGWIVFYLAIAAAALHPSMREVTMPSPQSEARLSPWRLLLLAAATLAAPAVLLVQWLRGAPLEIPVIAGACAVLFLAALARMYLLASQVSVQNERKRLLSRIIRATEEERIRIATDLHDGPVQQLTALSLTAYRAHTKLARHDPEAADELVMALEQSLEQEVKVLRELMTELRPPVLQSRGMEAALLDQARVLEARARVSVAVEADLGGHRLAPDLETLMYRLVQESLNNVAKHARADRATISLTVVGGTVELVVTDDGRGFDRRRAARLTGEGHLGLRGMQDRVSLAGGRLEVHSTPGHGTRIRATVPLRLGSTDGAGSPTTAEHG